jgi:hypothetical protein
MRHWPFSALSALSAVGFAVAFAFLPGCVERTLTLRSDPPGATVVVNGDYAGTTPVKFPFETYGVFDVVMSYPGHTRLHETVPVKAPWWEKIPIDFFVEDVWPGCVRDDHEATLTLKPAAAADESGIEQREQDRRARMQAAESVPAVPAGEK